MSAGITETVEVLQSIVGANGFGLINQPGGKKITGIQQPDGSYPVLVALGSAERLTWGKAIIDVEQGDAEISYLQFVGAAVGAGDGANGAGIRINQNVNSAYVHHVSFNSCQDGVLSNGVDNPNQSLLFEDATWDKCGTGDIGKTHNIYIGKCKEAVFRRITSTNSQVGHDLKSRALITRVENALIGGSATGRALDLSNGGIWISKGSAYLKPADATQNNLIHIAPEGTDGRPEQYESTNDLFQIDIPADGRALQFINNQGNAPCIVTDPKFILNGKELTPEETKPYLVGDVQIKLTGQPTGPQADYGNKTTLTSGSPVATPTQPAQPAPTPAPQPTPPSSSVPPTTSGNTPPASSTPVAATDPHPDEGVPGKWFFLGHERDPAIPVDEVNGMGLLCYGINNSWVQKEFSGHLVVETTNEFFGTDPAPGIQKEIWQFHPDAAPEAPPQAPTTEEEVTHLETAMIKGMEAFLGHYGITLNYPK
jgi:hypothetical protein